MIRIRNKKTYDGDGTYVGRPSPLGNPFTHLKRDTKAEFKVDTVEEAIDEYRKWLRNKIYNEPESEAAQMFFDLEEFYYLTEELTLLCWCWPDPCHADVIAELILERFES
tara:strand:- start:240 stop:569 length:330 start_codon:yes stop_codon:yes gene_type:complete